MANQLVNVANPDDATAVGEPVAQLNTRSRAAVRFGWGGARFEADVDLTPATMLAIGGMVGLILLGVAPIITAAGQARRRR